MSLSNFYFNQTYHPDPGYYQPLLHFRLEPRQELPQVEGGYLTNQNRAALLIRRRQTHQAPHSCIPCP